MTPRSLRLAPVIALFVLMLASLVMMSYAAENSTQFGRLYSLLLVINVAGLLTLVGLIFINIRRLFLQHRAQEPGARLTVRMVTMFILLAVTPVTIVYSFSIQFLHRGIDSWFDVRVETALDDSLELSKRAFDLRKRELLKRTHVVAEELSLLEQEATAIELDTVRRRIGASELTLLTHAGKILVSSGSDTTNFVPDVPTETVLNQLRQHQPYVNLDPTREGQFNIRAVVNLPRATPAVGDKEFSIGTVVSAPNAAPPVAENEFSIDTVVHTPSIAPIMNTQLLQALYPISDSMTKLGNSVQSAYQKYQELSYLRKQLKISFTVTLSLVLLFSIFTSVWAAFFSARRLAAPIRDLAEGTQAVAEGEYGTQLPVPGNDEMGFLVKSFNAMTRRIAESRDDSEASRKLAENQRAYLETVLGTLSSGVLTLNRGQALRTANRAADEILGVRLGPLIGKTLSDISRQHPHLQQLEDGWQLHIDDAEDWQAQVSLFGPDGRQVLMCRGTPLTGRDSADAGHVIVFDDVTTLLQAQRDAAWSEVARRMAHEIKNPLTPIQLSAERLRHKYLDTMSDTDAQVLDRLTKTIIDQVATLKNMVNTFAEYAKSPKMQPEPVKINNLLRGVVDLYEADKGRLSISLKLDPKLPLVEADPGRLRQVVHNLIKNALEASDDSESMELIITTGTANKLDQHLVEIVFQDNGPGIAENLLSQAFEPYVTDKTRGTGLGLSIVKKIIEEHNGIIWLENTDQGARVVVRLPAHAMQVTSEETPRSDAL